MDKKSSLTLFIIDLFVQLVINIFIERIITFIIVVTLKRWSYSLYII